MSERLEIHGVRCNRCQAIIFSRARHDFHYCPCEGTTIDGGFDYSRVGWVPEIGMPQNVTIHLTGVTKDQLFNDWNMRKNKFGVIPLA